MTAVILGLELKPLIVRCVVAVKGATIFMSNANKVRQRMYTFVAVIFAVGVVIAGSYLIMAKPGESDDKPVAEVINPNG
ncbi:hypothetical protein ACIQUB_18105 [Rhizobium sp. NPDC090275]|uniref:hypothetical protein n=1 Tax=Rhizobium sp. NPDC090275 TaxID=3364498 RepID=UPI00383AC330